MKAELAAGGRAYIVCPLVDESAAEGLASLRAAEEEHRRLAECGVLGEGVGHGLLHGRLSSDEKAAALHAFASGATQVLISTTVVEARALRRSRSAPGQDMGSCLGRYSAAARPCPAVCPCLLPGGAGRGGAVDAGLRHAQRGAPNQALPR